MKGQVRRRTLLITGLATFPALVAADDIFFGRRLRQRCGVPGYRYPQDRESNPVSSGSLRAVRYPLNGLLAVGTSAADGARGGKGGVALKTFQLGERSLTNDHCRISQVTVTVSSDGNWLMHMIAEQNPEILEPAQRPPFERFRRNQFIVDVRPTGLMTADQTESQAAVGKPEYPEIPPQEFWINKGQLARIRREGTSTSLRHHFELLEQVEVHFSYR